MTAQQILTKGEGTTVLKKGQISATLMQGDCLERMKEIPDGSVDMVLTDPPYGTTACKWDSIIPLEPMWKELKRITKKGGAIVMTASQPFTTTLISSNLTDFKYTWLWKKRPVNFLNAKKQPLRNFEDVVVFNAKQYNPQGLIPCERVNKRSNSTETNGQHGLSNVSEFTNYPTQLLEFIGERGSHPTQKPVDLLGYLIRTYSEQGSTVLDFTMGSGSTGVACMNTERNFIGIELDENYAHIAEQRITEALI